MLLIEVTYDEFANLKGLLGPKLISFSTTANGIFTAVAITDGYSATVFFTAPEKPADFDTRVPGCRQAMQLIF